jgi:hypothetical protein
VYFIVAGNRRLKILAAAAAAAALALGAVAVGSGSRSLIPLFSWVFAGRSPLYGSYILSLQHAVYELAGGAGAGREYIGLVDLVRPWDMPLNGVTYLALWLGNPAARAAVAALVALLAALFIEITRLRSPARRAAATGLWFLSAVNVYTGILALFFPEFLSISRGAWGMPYFGSFESSLQLLAMLLLVFTGETSVPAREGTGRRPDPRAGRLPSSDPIPPGDGLPAVPENPEGRDNPDSPESREGRGGTEGAGRQESPGGSGVTEVADRRGGAGWADGADKPESPEGAGETGVADR